MRSCQSSKKADQIVRMSLEAHWGDGRTGNVAKEATTKKSFHSFQRPARRFSSLKATPFFGPAATQKIQPSNAVLLSNQFMVFGWEFVNRKKIRTGEKTFDSFQHNVHERQFGFEFFTVFAKGGEERGAPSAA